MKKLIFTLCLLFAFSGLVLAQSPIDIEITPDEPIVVPGTPPGGWIDFSVSIENTSQDWVTFDAWIIIDLPYGSQFEIVSPVEISLPGGFSFTKDLSLFMPWFAPEGEYVIAVNVGDYPDDIWDSDGLTVIKEGSDASKITRKPFLVKGDLASMESAPITGFTDSDVEIEITPDEPIIIPAEGDWFSFEVFVENTTADEVTFDAWIFIELPWGFTFEVVSPVELVIPAGYQASAELCLYMPFFAPEGDYVMTAYVGDYPDTIWDTDMLIITKEAFDGVFKHLPGWQVKGDLNPDGLLAIEEVPTETALYSAYPNPFNPSTIISYQLPGNSKVLLKVYDVSGRLVTTLVDGFRGAGAHEVTFDASSLASGVYVYTLQAGDFKANGKMLLMK